MRMDSTQLSDIESKRQSSFLERLTQELRITSGESIADLDEAGLRSAVATAVDKAAAYGIVGGHGIRQFVNLAVLIDPRFDEQPDVRKFMGLADLEPNTKIGMLCELVTAKLRELAG